MRRRLALMLMLAFATTAGATVASANAAEPPGRKFVVFFQEWSVAIDDNARKVIAEAAEFAQQNPTAMVRVTGFADPTGTKKANVMLSELRAQRVADYLMDDGLRAQRIQQRGKGPVQFAISSLESRRVEITVRTK